MATKSKLGPVSTEERRAYRATIANDRAWRRPELKTAQVVWSLLESTPPAPLDDVLPKRRSRGALSAEEYDLDVRIAMQSLVVALDCAIAAGDRGAMLTKNTLFDALAARWSRRYHRAQRRGATTSYDMRVETVTRALRELLLAGVRLDTLWRIIAGSWSQSGVNPLFSVRLVQGKGHGLGYRVDVVDSDALQLFEAAVEADTHYRRPRQRRPLLLAEDWRPRRHRIRQEVCAERPYNVVNLGERSEHVLSILEGARAQFNVEVFREDYETLKAYLDGGHRPSVPSQWRNYRKLQGFVASYRQLYRQTGINVGGWVFPVQQRAWIRSRFFRASNRRYHAANLWPESVHKEFRARWFGLPLQLPRHFWDEGPPGEHVETVAADYVERDVATSQIQTLAVFLGLEDLEALAASEKPTLKEWLAGRLWTQHRELLADGYTGPQDGRLMAFVKEHLMRFYGADPGEIIRKCGKNPEKYGPGWKTSRGLWAKPTIKPGTKTVVLAKSGVTEATDCATEFFVKLPEWSDTLETFLAACQTLAEKPDGVVLHDPLDGAEVRWNHAQRGTDYVGHVKINVRPPGASTAVGFVPAPAGTIDRSALKRYVTPCLTHTLDAFFSGLVLEGLQAAGVTDVVALHDAWLVPEIVTDPSDAQAVVRGGAVLQGVIEAAGERWLQGLGSVYEQLVSDLGDDPTFGPFVRGIRARWRHRVKAKRWPRFLSR
jgi:hypothetical protein